MDSIAFLSFLESAGVLRPAMREMVIDRAMATGALARQPPISTATLPSARAGAA